MAPQLPKLMGRRHTGGRIAKWRPKRAGTSNAVPAALPSAPPTALPAAPPMAQPVVPPAELLPTLVSPKTTLFDVTANEAGQPELLPVGRPGCGRLAVADLPEDAEVMVRVFRFFEDRSDEAYSWEQKLCNVNSGSLLWVPVHIKPKLHSIGGKKYGKWFVVHHIKVRAKHFRSHYHMCLEGSSPADTFGSMNIKLLVSGHRLDRGYFWLVTPCKEPSINVASEESMRAQGWQHLFRSGPFDGDSFMKLWEAHGVPLAEEELQATMDHFLALAREDSAGVAQA